MPVSPAVARKNMVDSQIQTNGVASDAVLAAFREIPRETFLPGTMLGIAYNDEDIPLGSGRFILSPLTQSRLIEVFGPRINDSVLNIGDSTGYSSAILSRLVGTVVALEGRDGFPDSVRGSWNDLECSNIVSVPGANTAGCSEHAPYTGIVLNGSVSEVPSDLLSQLAPGGRLVCVLRHPVKPTGVIMKIARDENGTFSHSAQYDAVSPWLDGFVPRPDFRF